MKALRLKQEDEMKERDTFIQRLITKSIDLKNKILTIDEKKHQHTKKQSMFAQSHLGEMMSDLELSISKLIIDLKDESGSGLLGSMRDHLIEVYQKIGFGLLKR